MYNIYMNNFGEQNSTEREFAEKEGITHFSEEGAEAKFDAMLGFIEGVISGAFTKSEYLSTDGRRHVIIKNDSGNVLYDDLAKNFVKYVEATTDNLRARMFKDINTDVAN